jgi:hypothetical protein
MLTEEQAKDLQWHTRKMVLAAAESERKLDIALRAFTRITETPIKAVSIVQAALNEIQDKKRPVPVPAANTAVASCNAPEIKAKRAVHREETQASDIQEPAKRKRGRPPKSENKSIYEV